MNLFNQHTYSLLDVLIWRRISQYVILWAIGGAVIDLFMCLGRDSLWTQIAGINISIIVVTFAAVFLVLPIDFFEVGWLMLIIVIARFGMGLVTSFLVTRPLQILAEATQSIGEQDLSERVLVKGHGRFVR